MGELGRGAMGIVYKALDPTLGRHVALKILPAHLKEHPDLVTRFKREAMVAATLNHPNMVTVYAIGEDGGQYFIAMELVEGQNLAELLQARGPLEVDLAVDLIRQAASALSKAHPKGIIHRDIKPANLLVNDDMLLKVADFGLARLTESNAELTMAGDRLGTPRYMAPELFAGGAAGIATDTYALGVTLFELLTGHPGFKASNPAALMHLIINRPMQKVRALRPDVSSGLENIVMKATSKDPKMRYTSALDLINALDDWEQSDDETIGLEDTVRPLPVDVPDSLGVGSLIPTIENSSIPMTRTSMDSPSIDASGEPPLVEATPTFMQQSYAEAALSPDTPPPGNVDGIAQMTPPPLPKDELDFYIHYVPMDEQWAEWLYHLLTGVGYNAQKLLWDSNDPHETLRQLLKQTNRGVKSIAVASPYYLDAVHGQSEWIMALHDGRWSPFPVMVLNCVNMASTFGTNNYIDLVKQTREKARVLLLEECEELRGKPRRKSNSTRLKRRKKAQVPKLKDTIWSVPLRMAPHYVGRSQLLEQMRQRINVQGGFVTMVNPAPDSIGIGMTQLVVEFANLNKSNYSVVWWVRGSSRVSIQEDLSDLVDKLGLEEKSTAKINIRLAALKRWLELNTSWLIIFDDVRSWKVLREYLPREHSGHVLSTTNSTQWPKESNPITMPTLSRQESVDLLFTSTKIRSEGAAAALAASLSDTALALVLASEYMVHAKVGYDQYYDMFVTEHRKIWGVADPALNAQSVIRTAILVSLKRVRDENPIAVDLMKALTYLGDGPFPVSYVVSGAKPFPRALKKTLQNPRKFNELFTLLKNYKLISLEDERVSVMPGIRQAMLNWLELDLEAEETDANEEATMLLRAARWEQKSTVAWADLMGKFYEELVPEPDQVQQIHENGWLVPHIADYLRIVKAAPVDSVITSSLWLYTSTYLWMKADYVRASSACRYAIEERIKVLGPTHKKIAEMYLHSGNVYRAQGDNQRARTEYERALEILEKGRGKGTEEMASTLQQIGNICMDLEDYSGARQAYRRALEMDIRIKGADHESVCRDYTNLGLVAQELEDLTEAWDQYSNGLEIAEKTLDENHPMKAYVIKNMAGLLLRMGDQSTAKDYYLRAVKIDTEVHGKEHPYVAQSYNNLGLIMQNLGDIESAYNYFENAREINEVVYGKTHPKVAINLLNVGNLLNMKGDLVEAEKFFKRATIIFRERYGENHNHTMAAMKNWRNVRARQKGAQTSK